MPSTAGAIRAGRAFVEIFADNSKLNQGLRAAEAKLRAFGQTASTMGRAMVTTAAIAAFPIAMAVRTFRKFDDEMRFVQATTQAVGREFDMLTAKARDLGRSTSFTAQQVASGMAELGKAGLKPDEIDAVIASVLNLSRATRTDMPTSVKIAARALRTFALEAKDIPHVTDVLVTGVNNSTSTLIELGDALTYVSSRMAGLGETIDDTVAITAVLSNMGLVGSIAGTAANRLAQRLPLKETQDLLRRELGIQVSEINPVTGQTDIRRTLLILREIGVEMAKLGEEKRSQLGFEIFGIRAERASSRFAGDPDVINATVAAFENVRDAAKKAAEAMDAGLGGVWRRLISAFQDIQIEIGDRLRPQLDRLGRNIKDLLVDISKWVARNGELIVTITKSIAGLGLLGAAIWAVGAAATAMAIVIKLIIGAIVLLKGAVLALTIAIRGLAIAGVALEAAFLIATPIMVILGTALAVLAGAYYLTARAEGKLREENEAANKTMQELAGIAGKLASQQDRLTKATDKLAVAEGNLRRARGKPGTTEEDIVNAQVDIAVARNAKREAKAEIDRINTLTEPSGDDTASDARLREQIEQRASLIKRKRELDNQRRSAHEREKQRRERPRDFGLPMVNVELAELEDKRHAVLREIQILDRKIAGGDQTRVTSLVEEAEKRARIEREIATTQQVQAFFQNELIHGANLMPRTLSSYNAKLDAANAKLAKLREQLDDIGATPETQDTNNANAIWSEAFFEANQSNIDALNRIMIEGQEDNLVKTLALIDEEYKVRIRKAKDADKEISIIEDMRDEKRRQAIAADTKAIDDKWDTQVDAADDARASRDDELAALRIQASLRGKARGKALRDLQKDIELRQDLDAFDGANSATIEEKYRLLDRMAAVSRDSRLNPAKIEGSQAASSAMAQARFSATDPALVAQKKQVVLLHFGNEQRKKMLAKLEPNNVVEMVPV